MKIVKKIKKQKQYKAKGMEKLSRWDAGKAASPLEHTEGKWPWSRLGWSSTFLHHGPQQHHTHMKESLWHNMAECQQRHWPKDGKTPRVCIILLKIILLFIMCIVWVCAPGHGCLQRIDRGMRCPRARVTDSSEPQDVDTRNQIQVLCQSCTYS